MSAIKILIVEDDLIIATHLSSVLTSKGYEVIDTVTKGEKVPGIIAVNPPDIIIMDINLAGQLDGIETAKIISETTKIPVVFLTANVDNSTFEKSKSALPHAFLPKPFKEDQVLRTLEIISNRVHFNEEDDVEVVDKEEELQLNDRIFVKDKDRMVKLKIADIHFIQADRNYCKIMTDKKEYILSIPLKTFENKISSQDFVRVHRSYLVNLSLIDELDEHYVFIKGNSVPVSKSFKKVLSSKLKLI